jgi:hypothetical protein
MGCHRRNMGGSNKEERRETKESAGSTGSTPTDVGNNEHHQRDRRDEEGQSMIPGKEAESAQPVLTQLAVGHRILQLETDALELLMVELQQQ